MVPGCFVAGLEFSTGATAEVVGKPEPRFFEAALEDIRTEEEGMADLKKDGKDEQMRALFHLLIGSKLEIA